MKRDFYRLFSALATAAGFLKPDLLQVIFRGLPTAVGFLQVIYRRTGDGRRIFETGSRLPLANGFGIPLGDGVLVAGIAFDGRDPAEWLVFIFVEVEDRLPVLVDRIEAGLGGFVCAGIVATLFACCLEGSEEFEAERAKEAAVGFGGAIILTWRL